MPRDRLTAARAHRVHPGGAPCACGSGSGSGGEYDRGASVNPDSYLVDRDSRLERKGKSIGLAVNLDEGAFRG